MRFSELSGEGMIWNPEVSGNRGASALERLAGCSRSLRFAYENSLASAGDACTAYWLGGTELPWWA